MPRSPRIIVCSCEDLTLSDVEQCLEKGYRDIESVKRYTGFGTGICQGRSCLHNISKILVRHGVKEEDMKPFTPRPPVYPVPLGMLARLEPKDGPPDLKDEPGLQRQARGVRGGAVSRGGEDESLRQKRSDEGTMVGGRGETALPPQEERGSAPDRRLGESTEPHMPRHPDGRDTTHPEAVHPRQGIGEAQGSEATRASDGPPDPKDGLSLPGEEHVIYIAPGTDGRYLVRVGEAGRPAYVREWSLRKLVELDPEEILLEEDEG